MNPHFDEEPLRWSVTAMDWHSMDRHVFGSVILTLELKSFHDAYHSIKYTIIHNTKDVEVLFCRTSGVWYKILSMKDAASINTALPTSIRIRSLVHKLHMLRDEVRALVNVLGNARWWNVRRSEIKGLTIQRFSITMQTGNVVSGQYFRNHFHFLPNYHYSFTLHEICSCKWYLWYDAWKNYKCILCHGFFAVRGYEYYCNMHICPMFMILKKIVIHSSS
jgi:hypothetical protein